tara:strand:- start:1257 stop:2141 length:885 start_codon:yes stop_codon:yes gene_type:complete
MKVCVNCDFAFQREEWECPECGKAPDGGGGGGGYLCFVPKNCDANDAFNAEDFELLVEMEARNFWFTGRSMLLLWAFKRYFPAASSFFEVGCGTGFVLSGFFREVPHLVLAGSDLHSSALGFAQKRLDGVPLYQIDACHVPFEKEFDAIGAFDVLEHIHDDERALEQMFRAVKPGGGIMITVPQHQILWSAVDGYSHHKRRYSSAELIRKVEAAGFVVGRVTSFLTLLLPLMILSRIRWKLGRSDYDPISELRISSFLNNVLGKFMSLERWFIQLGVSFPAGGSLLLVARREES